MPRHVVVEGPDGSGKSRMVERIHTELGYPVHAKASDSITGPVQDLSGWTMRVQHEMAVTVEPMVFDRHPVISEPIYGRLVRASVRPGFEDRLWLNTRKLALMPKAVVIWCLPPLDVVRANLTLDRDMPGVVESIDRVYEAYVAAYRTWGGWSIRWDYTTGDAADVLAQIKGA